MLEKNLDDNERDLDNVDAVGKNSGYSKADTKVPTCFDGVGFLFTVFYVYLVITKLWAGTTVPAFEIICDQIELSSLKT